MITEDYVSFETAKLLKEKGFDVWGDGSFGTVTKIWKEYSPSGMLNDCSMGLPSRKAFPAPTLQMAMKWLREVHNIHIEVRYFFVPHIYKYTITYTPVTLDNIISHPQCFNTYEEACEAAIKYCLENLI